MMALNRGLIEQEMSKAKERMGGKIRYLKGGKTTRLRILEFIDEQKEGRFARLCVRHTKGSRRNELGVCTAATYGKECAFCRYIEAMREGGETNFGRNTKYLVNGIDLDEKRKKEVRVWALPTTVWQFICDQVLSDEWADLLSAGRGHYISIKAEGEQLDREYHCTISRKPLPVSKTYLGQVIDPMEVLTELDPVAQAHKLGVELSELFSEGEMESLEEEEGEAGEVEEVVHDDLTPEEEADDIPFEDESLGDEELDEEEEILEPETPKATSKKKKATAPATATTKATSKKKTKTGGNKGGKSATTDVVARLLGKR